MFDIFITLDSSFVQQCIFITFKIRNMINFILNASGLKSNLHFIKEADNSFVRNNSQKRTFDYIPIPFSNKMLMNLSVFVFLKKCTFLFS